MGWGDDIMATADARRLQRRDPRPVAVRDKRGGARWHPIWDGNPRLVRPDAVGSRTDIQWLENYPGKRPYLDYSRLTQERYAYNRAYRAEPGEIYLTAAERAPWERLKGCVVVEPNIKPGAPLNKDWGWQHWRQLVALLHGLPLVQLGAPGVKRLEYDRHRRHLEGAPFRVTHEVTRSLREAAAALSWARAIVCPEGGMHHAAAALGIPGVVIFGGYISPRTTGYELHTNLAADGDPCGSRTPCSHCRIAMNSIRPETVAKALNEILERTKSA